jgi:hypothetical protein
MQCRSLSSTTVAAAILGTLSSAPAQADYLRAYGPLRYGGLVSGAVGAYPGPPRYWYCQKWWTGMPVTGLGYPICDAPRAVVLVEPALPDGLPSRRVIIRRRY